MNNNIKNISNYTHLHLEDLIDVQNLSQKFNKTKYIKSLYKKKISINLSSDFTTSFLAEMLPLFLANKKIYSKIYEANFGSLNFLIRDLNNNFWKKPECDFFLLMPSSKKLTYLPKITDNYQTIKSNAKKEANIWIKTWKSTNKNIIQSLFDPLPYSNFGNMDGVKIGGILHYVRLVNSMLIKMKPSNVDLIDIENLLIKNEHLKWNDDKIYNLTKQPFSMNTIPYLSSQVSHIISGVSGFSKKVLVLDLDNTIWGGIIGDDGIKNIKLGDNTPEGEAFVNFQSYLKSLSNKGIILCVCSKNNHNTAMEVFLKHKDMKLKKDDITIFMANFGDKASNIKKISQSLNLNLDSFVFVDDSNVECSLVKNKLPEVMVINLSNKDPSDFVNILESSAPFYFNKITSEDINRKKSYKNLAIINTKLSENSNIESFLKNLQPQIDIKSVNKENCERMSQLIGKTNQFKLNSNFYSSKQLLGNKVQSLSISFKDKFHNYGIISALVYSVSKKDRYLEINNWVMSCRVFSRRIENYIVAYLIKLMKKNKLDIIKLKFEKTKKNLYFQIFINNFNTKIKKSGIFKTNIKKIKNDKKHYMN